MPKERNLTAIAKKLCSSSHGEIQLKVFDGGAAQNPSQLEKHIEMASFKEASVEIITFNKKKKKKR